MVPWDFRSGLYDRGQSVVVVTGGYRGTARGKLKIRASCCSKTLREAGVCTVRSAPLNDGSLSSQWHISEHIITAEDQLGVPVS